MPDEIKGINEFLRLERQCFFRLKCGSILFTIRTYIQSINEMTDDILSALLEVLEGRETRTSLGNAKGKYEDIKDICIQRTYKKEYNWLCNII